MYNIFASMTKASTAFGTYSDGNQVVPKGASILIPINVNEDATQEIPKSPQDQQNLDGTILKVFKGLDIPLTIACKKSKVDGKPNKKRRKSSKNSIFCILAFVFFQFLKSFTKLK